MWSRTEGDGQDILFVHGWSMDHRDEMRTYEPVFSRRPGWRRHYVDLPGTGRSQSQPHIRDLDGFLRALLGFIEGAVGRKPFALAGMSAGAYLARGVLARARERVLGLALRAPLVVPNDTQRDVDPVRPVVRNDALLGALPAGERVGLGEPLVQTAAYIEAKRQKLAQVVEPAFAAADGAFLAPIRGTRTAIACRPIRATTLDCSKVRP